MTVCSADFIYGVNYINTICMTDDLSLAGLKGIKRETDKL